MRTVLRGPAALPAAFGIAIALTAVGRQVQASAGKRSAHVAQQSVPRVTGTGTYTDPRSRVRVVLGKAIALQTGTLPRRGSIAVVVPVAVGNRATAARRYDSRNFYAVAESGEGYTADVRASSFPELGRGWLRPGALRAAWIGFALPARGGRYQVIWNDDNRLVPPAILETVAVRGR